MSNILVTAMGSSWQILPRILGFTNPNVVDLYRFHPSADRIAKDRDKFGIQPVDEIWVIATNGNVDAQLVALRKWHALLKPSDFLLAETKEWTGLIDRFFLSGLKIFQVSETDRLASETECRIMKEAILRIVLHAAEYASGGQLLMSLSGGFATMRTDMQFAASIFGCHAMIQIINDCLCPDTLTGVSNDICPEQFTVPLPADIKNGVTPLVTGKYPKSPLLSLSLANMTPITASNYPMIGSESGQVAFLHVDPTELFLSKAIGDRLEKSEYLAGFSTNAMLREDNDSNFLPLYCLPSRIVDELKKNCLGIHPEKERSELEWLKKLPKAALHCQLEGVLDTSELIRVANANHLLLDRYKMRTAFQIREWRRFLDRFSIADFRQQYPFDTIADAVRDLPEPVSLCAFIQMFNGAPALLDDLIYGNKQIESAFVSTGFNAYEALGGLQGERLLQSEASIRETCRILVEKAKLHHVRYLEIRCSPIKYTAGGLNPIQVVDMIEEEIGKSFKDFSILFTASRHRLKADLVQLVNVAKRIMEKPKSHCRLRGFDLAESGASFPARDLGKYISPIMEKCQHITINAGENADVESIWEAVYHLNAERISHSLTLNNNIKLMEEFLDRNIAIEMCPSSDFQIVGFRDNYIPETENKAVYPLKDYLDRGFRVTVNADNPGISRTDFSRELHRAARLTPGGLSIWDLLKIVQNGFKASFAEHATRNRMLREAEKEIIELIQIGIPQ
jgi:adenosine deaminase